MIVTCSEADRGRPLIKRDPTLVVEVLSIGTAAYDRGAKFAHYRQIPTLREIALIDPDTRRADVYRCGDATHPPVSTGIPCTPAKSRSCVTSAAAPMSSAVASCSASGSFSR